MTHEYEMVDQNILLYEARLKHIDEFCARAEKLIPQYPQMHIQNQLAPILAARDRLAELIKVGQSKSDGANLQKPNQHNHLAAWNRITNELDTLLKEFEALFSNHYFRGEKP